MINIMIIFFILRTISSIYFISTTLLKVKVSQNTSTIKHDIICIKGCVDKVETYYYEITVFYKKIVEENTNIINKIIESG